MTKIINIVEIDCKKKHALTNSYILPILGLDSIHIKK